MHYACVAWSSHIKRQVTQTTADLHVKWYLIDITEAWQQEAGSENEEYVHKGCSDDSFHIWVNVLMHKYSSVTTHAIPECL